MGRASAENSLPGLISYRSPRSNANAPIVSLLSYSFILMYGRRYIVSPKVRGCFMIGGRATDTCGIGICPGMFGRALGCLASAKLCPLLGIDIGIDWMPYSGPLRR